MRATVPILVLLVLVWLPGCGEDEATVRSPFVYDHFIGNSIDPSKWLVDTTGGGTITVGGSIARLAVNTPGGDMQATLEFPDALAAYIGTVSAHFNTYNYFQGAGSNVRFRLTTRAYQDDGLAGPGLTSVIFPQLRTRAGQFQAMVSRCTDGTCGTSTVIIGPTVMGTVTYGRDYDMAMTWDGDQGFSFRVDGVGSLSMDASFGGTFTRIGPPSAPRTLVEVQASSGAPTIGSITTDLDWVDCIRIDGRAC